MIGYTTSAQPSENEDSESLVSFAAEDLLDQVGIASCLGMLHAFHYELEAGYRGERRNNDQGKA